MYLYSYSSFYIHIHLFIFTFIHLYSHSSTYICSDPNNESDPSSEYSLLGLTHVMNHCLGQKFITWVKINCLDMSLKLNRVLESPDLAQCMNHFIFCYKCNTHRWHSMHSKWLIKLQGRRAISKC